MNTVGEVIEALKHFPPSAKFSVLLESRHFIGERDHEVPREVDTVQPDGSNMFNVIMTLGDVA